MTNKTNVWGQIFQRMIFGIFFILSSTLVANAESISVKALDTIAGYASHIETTQALSEFTDINIQVEKPNGSILTLPARTDKQGFAEIDVDGYHTKSTGLYTVSVAYEGKDYGAASRFQVFPDVFSPIKSQIITNSASFAAESEVQVRVQVKDRYNNPIPQQTIKLISSRGNDNIQENNYGLSNENGIASFSVSTQDAGISIFTAINQNIGQEIRERKKIIFHTPEESYARGGDDNSFASLLSANLMAENTGNQDTFGVLDHFEIIFSENVSINDDQNHLQVLAKDKDNNTVKSYTGTIRIVLNGDDNAIIPSEGEYTFTEKDQGEKTFALAMIFTTTGTKDIEVFDFEDGQINTNLSGKKTIQVAEKQADDNPAPQQSSDIEIKSPINGSELSLSTLIVSGLAVPNTNLKLLIDDMKVADVEVDMEGFFTSTVQGMEDGKHEMYIIESEGLRRASESVIITIDATAPRIDGKVEVFPADKIFTEESYTLTIYSEPKLDYVKVRAAGIEEQMTESSVYPGKYEISLIASQNPGSYNIDVIMADRMGNKADYRNQAEIIVEEKIIIKPEKTEAPLATAKDQQIDISWKVPASQNGVDHYNVYIGTDKYELKLATTTQAPSILLAKDHEGNTLKNNTEYFIAISTVDKESEEGEMSDLATAKPEKYEPIIVKAKNPVHSAAPVKLPLRAISGDSKVTLSWDEFPEAQKYKILGGIKKGSYELELTTDEAVSSFVIKDLINNLPYYFSIIALDAQGIEISEQYPAVKSTPNGYGFKVIPTEKQLPQASLIDYSDKKQIKGNTGPEEILLSIFAISITLLFMFFRRRNKLSIANPVLPLSNPIQKKMQF